MVWYTILDNFGEVFAKAPEYYFNGTDFQCFRGF